MIDTPETLRLPVHSGEPVSVMTSWNKRAKRRFLKLRMGDKEAIIPRDAFVRAALLLGDEIEQEKLVPTRSVTIRHFRKTLLVKMKKRMEEGELLELNVAFDVPLSEQSADALTFNK